MSDEIGGSFIKNTPVLTISGARAAMKAALAEAGRLGLNFSIAITDPAGELLAFERMDGAPSVTIAVAQGKAVSAALTRLPTKIFQNMTDGGNASLLSVPRVVSLEGGVPILVGDAVVGAIGASGASGEQDAQVAQAGADAVV